MKRICLLFFVICLFGCERAIPKLKGEKMSIKYENLNKQHEEIDVILTQKEIQEYNQYIEKHCNAIYDVEIESISKKQIKEYIQKYSLPPLPKYDGDELLTSTDYQNILDNCNLANIKDLKDIQKGIIVNKTNLKSFPTYKRISSSTTSTLDQIQETELQVNTTIAILHESLDHEWYFIVSPIYRGWVNKEDIALANESDLEYFNSSKFGIITEDFLEVENTLLNMSVKLPLERTRNDYYVFTLPIKKDDGYVGKEEINIDKKYAHIGYLPYTNENVVTQAFKYEGITYSWGGKGWGIDCSGFISNIFRTFGFELPRNTDDQESCFKDISKIDGLTNSEKLNQLKGSEPSILYQNGHVMLYLGMKNGQHYMIHASGSKMKVVYEPIDETTSNLFKIDRFIQVK